MNSLSVPVKDLIPKYWHLPSVKTTDDLLFFGKHTIRQLVRWWRSEAESLSGQIKSQEELLGLVRGKTGKDFAELAKTYENPEFIPTMIGVMSDTSSGDFEPLDEASRKRQFNATTFNVCGWCKYVGGGGCRYQYHITADCNFLTYAGLPDSDRTIPEKAVEKYLAVEPLSRLGATEGEKQAARLALVRMEATYPGLGLLAEKLPFWSAKTQRRFNTPCFLPHFDSELMGLITKGMENRKTKLIKEKRHADRHIQYLLILEKQAKSKPVLSGERPHDWFNVGDPVYCYVGSWPADRLVKDNWVTGKVIFGYRHHDGCVSVRFDQRMHTGPYLDGHGSGYGMSRPEIVHDWEFLYLCDHPVFAKVWLEAVDIKDVNSIKMLETLSKPKTFFISRK